MRNKVIFLFLSGFWLTGTLWAKAEFTPTFKNFYLGQSYAQIEAELKKHQALFTPEFARNFRMDFPLFLYLSTLENRGLVVDAEKERVYLDEHYFFDFRDLVLSRERVDFFYRDHFYYLVLKELESVPVDYPSRVNPHLRKLKFKFFRKQLYSIEYEAELSGYQISRLRENYQNRYNVKLDRKEQKFEAEEGIYIVRLEPEKGRAKIIITSKKIYQQIERALDDELGIILEELLTRIEERLEVGENIKALIFQEKKRRLKDKIGQIYQKVDEL